MPTFEEIAEDLRQLREEKRIMGQALADIARGRLFARHKSYGRYGGADAQDIARKALVKVGEVW